MKPLAITFVLAACLYSCASPDKKTISTGDSTTQKTDTGASSTSKSVSADSADQPRHNVAKLVNSKFYLKGEDMMVPPYGLEKIKVMTANVLRLEEPDGGDEYTDSLDKKVFDSLTLREKFTYNMIHPEFWAQNCDILPFHKEKSTRIFGTLPEIYGEMMWSDTQTKFFKDHRDSIQVWMKEQIEKEGRIGENFREAIVEMNATGMIPVLVEIARKETKDHYTLTTLLLLMEKNNYSEYMSSSSYKKLADHSSYENPPYLVYNKANEDLIIQRATNFYNGLAKN
jgi:hypothetical protein